MNRNADSARDLELLSELVLTSNLSRETNDSAVAGWLRSRSSDVTEADIASLESLASSNHVVLRAFAVLNEIFQSQGKVRETEWLADAINREQDRINHALNCLEQICMTLEDNDCPVTIIKSLDHWPDLGSDLDLYTDADSTHVIDLMKSAFQAKLTDRSWGDRLANKWNFIVPGVPELVEVHGGRLGQTGEQTAITRSVADRARQINIQSHVFRVAAPEDRIVISTLQRMYRHFYIRLCDIADNARLVDLDQVDFGYLHSLGSSAGLWEGIATYLVIISQYVERYRGRGITLPAFVVASAKFGGDEVRFRRSFLRVPILPHSIHLYASELKSFLLRGDLRNGFRLSLLPCLATAAALEMRITGSDKGIW
jgi:hypothetical protein